MSMRRRQLHRDISWRMMVSGSPKCCRCRWASNRRRMSASRIESPAFRPLVVCLAPTSLAIGWLGLDSAGRVGTILLQSLSDAGVEIYVAGPAGFRFQVSPVRPRTRGGQASLRGFHGVHHKETVWSGREGHHLVLVTVMGPGGGQCLVLEVHLGLGNRFNVAKYPFRNFRLACLPGQRRARNWLSWARRKTATPLVSDVEWSSGDIVRIDGTFAARFFDGCDRGQHEGV